MPLYDADTYKILFLDIETVSEKENFASLEENWQELWEGKTRFQRAEDETAEEFYPKRAGILAEFGKVVCISCGFFTQNEGKRSFRVKSFYDVDEATLLASFADMLRSHFDKNGYVLCAHNGKEFDFPFIARRMVVHGIKLPILLNTSGLKPWEIRHIDTMEMWKFGDYKNYTSVKLLAALFNIPTPKDDIDGSMVGHVYWQEKDIERIVTYCQKDTITVARIYLKMQNEPFLEEEEIIYS